MDLLSELLYLGFAITFLKFAAEALGHAAAQPHWCVALVRARVRDGLQAAGGGGGHCGQDGARVRHAG